MHQSYSHKLRQKKGWLLICAKDGIVSRSEAKVAVLLRDKRKATYTPRTDGSDGISSKSFKISVFFGKTTKNKI